MRRIKFRSFSQANLIEKDLIDWITRDLSYGYYDEKDATTAKVSRQYFDEEGEIGYIVLMRSKHEEPQKFYFFIFEGSDNVAVVAERLSCGEDLFLEEKLHLGYISFLTYVDGRCVSYRWSNNSPGYIEEPCEEETLSQSYDEVLDAPEPKIRSLGQGKALKKASKKYTFERPFKTPSDAEESAYRKANGKEGRDLSNGELLVINLHWFSRKGDKDVFFHFRKNEFDDALLILLMVLEDSSFQYVQAIPTNSKAFERISRAPEEFPDLVVSQGKDRIVYRWGSANRYEIL
jgi:hypothetical protein